jgi:uncharacterized protein (TIGR02598 family)
MKKSGERARGLRVGASGFSLVEVVLALAIIAVTFIGLIGLLGLGVANDQTSSEQTVATNIAASILSDLRSTPIYSSTGKSTRYGLTLPTTTTANSAKPLSGLTATTLYFDNTGTYIPTSASTIPIYAANVYLTRTAYVGPNVSASLPQSNDMVRIVVSWPAKTTTTPVGSVDIISQFLVH